MGRWILRNGVFGLAPIIKGPGKSSKQVDKPIEPAKPLMSEPPSNRPSDNIPIEELPPVQADPIPVTEDQILPSDPPVPTKKKKKRKHDKERYVGAGWFEMRTDENGDREGLVEKPKH